MKAIRTIRTVENGEDGSLRISAIEQVDFIKQVVRRTLPFSPHADDTLRDIMV